MSEEFHNVEPIFCAPLLRKVDAHLIDLLSTLASSDWEIQTVSPSWQVRDVAAHLLDTALRKLSLARDRCFVEAVEIRSLQDVANLVNRLNREGVTVYRRLSPDILIGMMKSVCDQSASFHESLDPFATAAFSVSWAGEETSQNWFDTARELTERWHHQQQIRLAVGRPGIMTPELYHPVLDCFMRGLPHAYRNVDAPIGMMVQFSISGECGGDWFLIKGDSSWKLVKASSGSVLSLVTMPQEIAWRIFTKGIARDSALNQIQIVGMRELGLQVLNLTAIVA